MTPLQVFASAFCVSSFAGLAALLRSDQPLTLRSFASATMYSGSMGLIIAFLWYKNYGEAGDPYFLLGVSGLAGIGGVTVVDLVSIAIKKGGLIVKALEKDQK